MWKNKSTKTKIKRNATDHWARYTWTFFFRNTGVTVLNVWNLRSELLSGQQCLDLTEARLLFRRKYPTKSLSVTAEEPRHRGNIPSLSNGRRVPGVHRLTSAFADTPQTKYVESNGRKQCYDTKHQHKKTQNIFACSALSFCLFKVYCLYITCKHRASLAKVPSLKGTEKGRISFW